MIKKAVLFGYFGSGNLGDETNLREICSFLREEFPQISLTVISERPRETVREHGTSAISRHNFFGIIRQIKQADLLLGVGGTLFQDYSSFRSLVYYCWLLLVAYLFGTEVFLHGQGFTMLHSDFARKMLRKSLNTVVCITVRDELSFNVLEEIGVKHPELYLTADPLLSLTSDKSENSQVRDGLPRLGCLIRAHRERRSFWKKFLLKVRSELHVEPCLIVIDQTDHRYNMELSLTTGAILSETLNWEKCRQLIGELDLLISERLHGLILATLGGTPCCGLSSDTKIDAFCLQQDIPFIPLLQQRSEQALLQRIQSMLDEPEQFKPSNDTEKVWRQRALENYAVLRGFLSARN